MKEKQFIHIAMLNSFSLITGSVSLTELQISGLPMLVHDPLDDVSIDVINDIIEYFESIEMYEKCAKLKNMYKGRLSNNNYYTCECDFPIIKKYTEDIRCDTCRKRISR